MAASLSDFKSPVDDTLIGDTVQAATEAALEAAADALAAKDVEIAAETDPVALATLQAERAVLLAELNGQRGLFEGTSYHGDFRVHERLDAAWNTVDRLRAPVFSHEAATKGYVDGLALAAIAGDSAAVAAAQAYTDEATPKSNLDAVVDPNWLVDHAGLGYERGSVWINTLTLRAWTCVDVGPGQAWWVQTTNGPEQYAPKTNLDAEVDPDGLVDHAGLGYARGSVWVNTVGLRAWTCVFTSAGPPDEAWWVQTTKENITKFNLGLGNVQDTLHTYTSAPPLPTDDETKGHSVGSVWVDQTPVTGGAYICTEPSTPNAVWEKLANAAAAAAAQADATQALSKAEAALPLAGGTMSGPIDMAGSEVYNAGNLRVVTSVALNGSSIASLYVAHDAGATLPILMGVNNGTEVVRIHSTGVISSAQPYAKIMSTTVTRSVGNANSIAVTFGAVDPQNQGISVGYVTGNPFSLTIGYAGVYHVGYRANMSGTTTVSVVSGRQAWIYISSSGTTKYGLSRDNAHPAYQAYYASGSELVYIPAGATVRLQMYQTSGQTLNFPASTAVEDEMCLYAYKMP